MSSNVRIDLLGLSELDAALPGVSGFADSEISTADGLAAQRAFAEMKQLFLSCVENLEHRKGAWLRRQVRAAADPIDLWLLRGPLLATLREDEQGTRQMRAQLYRSLDNSFPQAFAASAMHAGAALRA